MKILDVDLLENGLQRIGNQQERLRTEMTAIQQSIEALIAMDEVLKGKGGTAIKSFYEECHLPLHQTFQLFSQHFSETLVNINNALESLESSKEGYIREAYLEGEIETGLTSFSQLTSDLTNQSNDMISQVSDIVALPQLDDSMVQEGVSNARKDKDETIDKLHEFDTSQNNALSAIEEGINLMNQWISMIESLFLSGRTDIRFETNQWKAMTLNSELKDIVDSKTYPMITCTAGDNVDELIGTEIDPEILSIMENGRIKSVEGELDDTMLFVRYHVYDNGLIVKEFQKIESDQIQYEIVSKVEEAQESEDKNGFEVVADFLIMDDIRTLTDPNASFLDKGIAAASVIPLPVGKLVKGGSAAVKAVDNAADASKAADKVRDASRIIDELPPIENGPYIKNGKPRGRPQLSGDKKLEFERKVYDDNVGPDGILRDPNTMEVLDWKPGQPRKGAVDFGHRQGYEYHPMFEKYRNREITLEELKEFQFNPENFRIESPGANRSRKFEGK
ncbi:T7SS effector LXG polymorphic toxin [Psychrobacillus sp. FSL W7-1457]|uniref:T7SS effector LXG polymorphic toxin n=1 Tax=unclassified Psychrobacillus TaxID=2636677 RepID=UPI0030F9B5CD